MTFSDNAVKKMLNEKFSCGWTDTSGEESAGGSFCHKPKDAPVHCLRGNGEHNVQMLICTPGGELLHVVAGYAGPKELLEELNFALRLWTKLSDVPSSRRAEAVEKEHEQAIAALEKVKPAGPFGGFEKSRRRDDHAFVKEHPLMPASEFKASELVGNGKSFFGSSNGEPGKDLIGDTEAAKALEELKKRKKTRTE